MLTPYESDVLECCRANLHKIEANKDYVAGGKFDVGPKDNPSRGKCYLASAALSDFLGGPKGGYHLAKATNHLGDHYWVVNEHGSILDPTKEQFTILGERPPYRHGRKVGKRNTLKKHLPLLEALREEFSEGKKPAKDLFGRALVVPREQAASLTEAQQETLNDAWRALIGDWAERPEEFMRSYFSKGAMAVHFVRALLFGEEIPRYATMAYTWDRYYVAGSAYPFCEMLPAALEKPNVLRGTRFALADEISYTKLISGNLPIGGYRIPFDFPIGLAKKLIDDYCPAGGRVLDPCHGWGGRLVGFMLSHASAYTGIDPAPHSPKLSEMFDDLSGYLDEPKRLKLINKPFEDVALRQANYDFAITSPPYFNTEKYKGEESSWRRYKTLDGWIDGFFRELICGVADALKPGAMFALQITPKFDLVNVAKKLGEAAGLEYVEVADTDMRRYNSASADKAGSTELFEVVVIFRRRS